MNCDTRGLAQGPGAEFSCQASWDETGRQAGWKVEMRLVARKHSHLPLSHPDLGFSICQNRKTDNKNIQISSLSLPICH